MSITLSSTSKDRDETHFRHHPKENKQKLENPAWKGKTRQKMRCLDIPLI